jgi:methyl-accepting chemotaxis protein
MMNSLGFFTSLRMRLIALTSLILLIIAMFQAYFYPLRLRKSQRRHMEERIVSLAIATASNVAAALEFDDQKTAQEVLEGLSHVADFDYAVVFRSSGEVMAEVKQPQAHVPYQKPGEHPVVTQVGRVLRADQLVRGKGGGTGTLTLGLSMASQTAEEQEQTRLGIAVAVIVFLFGCLSIFVVGTIVIGPVRLMTELALRIADGDLSQPSLDIVRTDEVGRMAAAFDKMLAMLRQLASIAERLGRGDLSGQVNLQGQVGEAFRSMVEGQRGLVRQIAEVALTLGGTATQIHAAMREQDGSTTKQAAAVTEVSATVHSLLESARDIADSAHGVFDNAERSRQTTDNVNTHVQKLHAHTARIAELLEVIREISDRSDLLALNASLEATRAGEAGRAFSLVASEMRRLAERVTASVQDVKSLLVDIRGSTEQTALTTGDSRRLVESTTESARQISMVTEQQRTATGQVLESMRELSNHLSASVTSVREVRSSSERLHSTAARLNQLVQQFKLESAAG